MASGRMGLLILGAAGLGLVFWPKKAKAAGPATPSLPAGPTAQDEEGLKEAQFLVEYTNKAGALASQGPRPTPQANRSVAAQLRKIAADIYAHNWTHPDVKSQAYYEASQINAVAKDFDALAKDQEANPGAYGLGGMEGPAPPSEANYPPLENFIPNSFY